jgi:hypothetical protein
MIKFHGFRLNMVAVLAAAFITLGCGSSSNVLLPESDNSVDSVGQGRAVLAQFVDPAVVAGIDALPPEQFSVVYSNISLWNDSDPQLTGTVEQACNAVETISESTFGPEAVYQLISRLTDNGQSTVLSFGRNLDPLVEQGVSRCADSLSAQAAPQSNTNRNPEVISLLGPSVNTMTKFHALRQLLPGTLPEGQRAALKSIRDTLTYPANGQRIQKVIKVEDMQNYLNGTFDPDVFGFQAVLSDVDNLTTAAALIEGLRLDYPNGFQGETTVAALVWFQDETFRMVPPYRAANGGDRTDSYPFTGNGFTATNRGNAIPEWILPASGVALQNGAQLLTVDNLGNRILQATLQNGTWLLANNKTLPVANRQRVDRPGSYKSNPVQVISKDDEFYHVNATGDLGLIDQRQVGPAEYRGKIYHDDAELLLQ